MSEQENPYTPWISPSGSIFHVTPAGYIEVPVYQEEIDLAIEYADSMPNQKHTIEGWNGRFLGSLGEQAVAQVMDWSITHTYDYDFLIDDIRIDVKTKKRQVVPESEYEASVYAWNNWQKCDRYIAASALFIKHLNMYTHVYVIGIIDQQEYHDKARYLEKGQWDYKTKNKYYVHESCWNVHHREFTLFPNKRCESSSS